MNTIFQEINNEIEKQNSKWGEQNHKPIEWCAILGEEVGEVQKAALETHLGFDGKTNYNDYREELIQVAAVAVQMIASLERNKH